MKNSWLWSICTGYALFMIGILTLVFIATNHHSELVTENYYEQGQQYQTIIDAKQRVKELVNKPILEKSKKGISFFTPYIDNGILKIICPSDQKEDLTFNLINNKVDIDYNKLNKAMYCVQYEWKMNDTLYVWEENLYLP
jgi:hypothetical protein